MRERSSKVHDAASELDDLAADENSPILRNLQIKRGRTLHLLALGYLIGTW